MEQIRKKNLILSSSFIEQMVTTPMSSSSYRLVNDVSIMVGICNADSEKFRMLSKWFLACLAKS